VADVVELIRANPDTDKLGLIRDHLAALHPDYVRDFDRLAERARDQGDD
jgi:hypothetical protein